MGAPETACLSCVLAEARPASCEDRLILPDAVIETGAYEQYCRIVTYGKFLLNERKLQNQENVVSVKADVGRSLEISDMAVPSHDFH